MYTGKNILSEDNTYQTKEGFKMMDISGPEKSSVLKRLSNSSHIEPEFHNGKFTSFSICQNPAYRVLSNSYYGMCVNDGTTIEKKVRNIYRNLIINMRNKDLYDAYHKYDQVILGCTRNTKFDWKLDTLAKMAYYGLDANKFLFLQTMRYPRASKSWLMISSYIKSQQLLKDLDNHSTPNLHNVVYWGTLNDMSNYLEGLEVRNVSSAPLRYIQALQFWDEMSRFDEQMASFYNEFHDQFIKNSNNRSDMKTDWLKRKTK